MKGYHNSYFLKLIVIDDNNINIFLNMYTKEFVKLKDELPVLRSFMLINFSSIDLLSLLAKHIIPTSEYSKLSFITSSLINFLLKI